MEKAQSIIFLKIDKLKSIKIYNFCSAREHMKKMHTSYREKIFANHVPDEGLVSRTNEKLKKQN